MYSHPGWELGPPPLSPLWPPQGVGHQEPPPLVSLLFAQALTWGGLLATGAPTSPAGWGPPERTIPTTKSGEVRAIHTVNI